MIKTRLKILIMLLIAIVAINTVSAVSAAVDSVDSKDKVYSVESKEKSAANKITWNANGGTVGSKKTITTNVKKGSKIGKLPATPKRSGHTFSGWYTKKTGGSKIGVNTKPTKAITYYAQWKKSTPAKSSGNSKYVGKWIYTNGPFEHVLTIKSDGTFTGSNKAYSEPSAEIIGVWSKDNQYDFIWITHKKVRSYDLDKKAWKSWSADNNNHGYSYVKHNGKDSLRVDAFSGYRYYYKV